MNFSKKLKIVSGIALILFSTVNSHSQEISLMSYNIGSSNWAITKDSVIGRVLDNDPDVFCAIEAGPMNRPFVETSLTEYRLIKTFGDSPNLTESHIFIRNDKFIVIDSGYAEMETYVGYGGMGRYVNWAQLQDNITGLEFIVYASHYVSTMGGGADSAYVAQSRHSDGMIQLMNEHIGLDIPQITVGDFNASVLTDIMKFLLDQTPITYYDITINNPIVLDDSWEIANPGMTKPATTSTGSSAIDWILTTTNTHVTSAIIDDQGVNDDDLYPSDHLPLQITFELTDGATINEELYTSNLITYPNPFVNSVRFKFNTEIDDPVHLEIHSIDGQLVYTSNMVNNEINVDLNQLQEGSYFYTLTTEKSTYSGVLIKSAE